MSIVGIEGEGLSSSATVDGAYSIRGEEVNIYSELWHACAGSPVLVPRAGERIFYFPQGHLEQIEAYTHQDGKLELPIYDLPSKILCRVVDVQIKADAQTDEVFAQVTLLPEAKEDFVLEDKHGRCFPCRTNVCSFCKILTPSDTNIHGGFSIPKRWANECLPPLDMSLQPPAQELIAKDLHGYPWHFRHIYRGQPKRHLLTSGWSTFVTAKKVVAGDALIFLRGENGELYVGIRHVKKQQKTSSPSVLSGPSMLHGILASAFHAFSTGTMFTAYYHPWTSPSEYIIPFDHYVKSTKCVYSVGTRFTMKVEDEECAAKRFAGTIVAIEEIDRIRWPRSEWRCLKVQWDAVLDKFVLPKMVSPWSIKVMESTINNDQTCHSHQEKKRHAVNSLYPGFPGLARNGVFESEFDYHSQRTQKVLQGQEKNNADAHVAKQQNSSSLVRLHSSSYLGWVSREDGSENHLPSPMHGPFYQCPRTQNPFPESLATPSSNNLCTYKSRTRGVHQDFEVRRNSSNVNSSDSGSVQSEAIDLIDEANTPMWGQKGCQRLMIFGVNLVNCQLELPSQQVANHSQLLNVNLVPPTSQSSVSRTSQVLEPFKHSSGTLLDRQCRKGPSTTGRNCTKVLKYGTALGRSVDLTRFQGYDELIHEFDKMFEFKGKLIDGSSNWCVTYTDHEGNFVQRFRGYSSVQRKKSTT